MPPWRNTAPGVTLATGVDFLTALEARSPRSRSSRAIFPGGFYYWLAGREPSCVLTGLERELSGGSSYLNTNPIRSSLTHTISFNLSYFVRGPISKYSYGGGLELGKYEFGGRGGHEHSVPNTWVQAPCLKFSNCATLSKSISCSKFSDYSSLKWGWNVGIRRDNVS